MRAWANTQAKRVVFSSAKRFAIPSEVACQAVALCEGWRNPVMKPLSNVAGSFDFAQDDWLIRRQRAKRALPQFCARFCDAGNNR